MQSLKYTVGGTSCYASRETILKAMRCFDRELRGARPERGRKYFVWWRGKPYPPKDVLRCMSNGPKGDFSGGNAINQIFRDLEFHVGKGKLPKRLPGTDTPVPPIATKKKQLFARRWSTFKRDFLKGREARYPGVYLLAYANESLRDKLVKPDDVFYVGSSCTGLKTFDAFPNHLFPQMFPSLIRFVANSLKLDRRVNVSAHGGRQAGLAIAYGRRPTAQHVSQRRSECC
jgi:hypothetical protein